jgi:hypothetical protein
MVHVFCGGYIRHIAMEEKVCYSPWNRQKGGAI